MKRLKTLFYAFTSLVVLGACTSDSSDSYGGFDYSGERTVNFTGNIQDIGAELVDQKWNVEDAIGIYAIHSGEALSAASLFKEYDNVKYTTVSTSTKATFKAAKETDAVQLDCRKIDIVSYYPYSNEVKDYQYPINTEKQHPVLYANNVKRLICAKGNSHLIFNHKLAQLVLKIEAEDEETSLAELKSDQVLGTLTEGVLHLKDGAVQVKEGAQPNNIKPISVTSDKLAQIKAILLPNQLAKNAKVALGYEGKTLTWSPEDDVTLESGKIYIYTIKLKSDGTIETVNPNAEIADWVEGNPDTDVDIITPDEEEVVDDVLSVNTYLYTIKEGGAAQIEVEASNQKMEWSMLSGDSWIEVKEASGVGTGAAQVFIPENTTGRPRTGFIILTDLAIAQKNEEHKQDKDYKKKDPEQLITVYQDGFAKSGEIVEVLNETFGLNTPSRWDLKNDAFNTLNRFNGTKNGLEYSNEGTRVAGRSINTLLDVNNNFERHLWFFKYEKKLDDKKPALPTLKISNFDTQDLTEITLSYDILGDMKTQKRVKSINTDWMSVYADGEALKVESKELPQEEYIEQFYTVTISIEKPFSELVFKTDERNATGIRLDNIKISGKKTK